MSECVYCDKDHEGLCPLVAEIGDASASILAKIKKDGDYNAMAAQTRIAVAVKSVIASREIQYLASRDFSGCLPSTCQLASAESSRNANYSWQEPAAKSEASSEAEKPSGIYSDNEFVGDAQAMATARETLGEDHELVQRMSELRLSKVQSRSNATTPVMLAELRNSQREALFVHFRYFASQGKSEAEIVSLMEAIIPDMHLSSIDDAIGDVRAIAQAMYQYTDRDTFLESEEFAALDKGYQKAIKKFYFWNVKEKSLPSKRKSEEVCDEAMDTDTKEAARVSLSP